MNEKVCKPLLKWVGGKRQLLPTLRHIVGTYSEIAKVDQFSYHEPFFGGGALFFDLVSSHKIKKSYINDINRELILMYEVIRSKKNSEKMMNRVLQLEDEFNNSNSRDVLFTNWKEKFNKLIYKLSLEQSLSIKEQIEISALLISLNKTCFNGIYRKNKKGQFNVPFGKKNTGNVKFIDIDNFKNINSTLEDTTITNVSFESAINFKQIKKNHLVFVDPPYIPISKTAQFKDYYDDGFSIADHENLAQKLDQIDSNGAYFILTNSNTDLVREVYLSKKHYSLSEVAVSRAINQIGRNDLNAGIKELLITNFKFSIPTQMSLGI
jgi:DNA adenine methylase